ncbi:MAG: serine/threonine-protein kinase [Planctomycetota bacterium]|nr:serine/threonine-protein kinase [Planctomycetota bacterium]
MAVSLKQFIEYLAQSGIMSEQEVRDWIAEQPLETRPTDGAGLAKRLREKGRLTKFQTQRLYQGKYKSLEYGNYRLIKAIGRGGMGTVYEAEHVRMKHRVAIKVISTKVTESEKTLRRFLREVEAAAKLSHPNVVAAIDADRANKKYYMVMELVEGEDLGMIARRETILSVAEVLDYMTQAAVGLAYAHEQGIIHRDIKPHNMLLDREGVLKILDMGLVSLQRPEGAEDDSLTQNNQIIGTVDYMSPEQAENIRNIDQRADIYSLGCSIYRLLVGHPPFPGESAIQKLLAHRDHPIPSLRDQRDDIPELLDQVFQRMIAKNPDDRFQTMDDVVAALETCRMASISILPELSIDSSTASRIDTIDLDLEIEHMSTMETEKPEILTSAPQIFKTTGRSIPNIEAEDTLPQINTKRAVGKVNYLITILSLIILAGLAGFVWYQNRPGYAEVYFPLEFRQQRWQILIKDKNKEIFHINDNQSKDLENTNPVTIALPPGKYTFTLERPPYFANTGSFTIERGNTMVINGQKWDTSDLQELGLDGETEKLVPQHPESTSPPDP